MQSLAKTIAFVAALTPGLAMAAEPVCLTKKEATALIAYALPQAINGTAKRCSTSLPADAFLRRQGPQLAARYAGQKNRYWPQAKPAFMKTLGAEGSGSAQMVANLPDETVRQLADVFVEGFVSQRIALKSCTKLDLAIDLLSPLPPENTAGLIALTLEVAATADPKLGKVALCRD
ncbi:hypothetical protein [Novosphingobium sp. AP12]|uniref:hypothetical protein n=1 Tax=Novosphingobium sp. AP12 TaxID=1144305 RepID=UPI00027223E1|nr:hypothetical protein [Novosphingobium sp. AP12]EJL29626.1 hypothetical protein PMI02_02163 [Novosphingobium sp. AP12]